MFCGWMKRHVFTLCVCASVRCGCQLCFGFSPDGCSLLCAGREGGEGGGGDGRRYRARYFHRNTNTRLFGRLHVTDTQKPSIWIKLIIVTHNQGVKTQISANLCFPSYKAQVKEISGLYNWLRYWDRAFLLIFVLIFIYYLYYYFLKYL